MQKIVSAAAGILNVEINSAGAYEIASRSRGTPRIANRLLKRVLRLCARCAQTA